MGGTREKLQSVGVQTLAIIEDRLEPVRRYFRLRPPRVLLAADPDRGTYRSFGVPMPPRTAEYQQAREVVRINPTGELPEPLSIPAAQKRLDEMDRMGESVEAQEVLRQLPPRDFTIHAGHFLLDRDGVVRWTRIEAPADDLSGWGKFPSDDELLVATRTLPKHP